MKTYSIITFGCQMNHSDSERVAAICESMGYSKGVDKDVSDLYIVNTCSIRQKAEDRVLGMGKKFFKFKEENPEVKVVLTGCMAKRNLRQNKDKSLEYQDKYKQELRKKMPWLDFVLEINEIHKLPQLLQVNTKENINEYFSLKPKYNSQFQAFVPISTGCNKFCTFCIVPFTRGEEVYRPYEDIYNEVKSLVEKGYKEITLLGQNVNSWKSSIKDHLKVPVPKFRQNTPSDFMDFADLMEGLADIPGKFWLRFTSSHPYDINPRLIDVVAKKDNIAKQFHFALQSGSDAVLKRMNRYYTAKEFLEKVNQIKKTIHKVGITTDVIVGFCGETDDEFSETLKLCEEIKFDQIFISEYSQRKGTIAAKFYEDNIPAETKALRKIKLDKVLKKHLLETNQKLINKEIEALVVKKSVDKFYARSSNGKEIVISNSQVRIGDFVKLKINSVKEFLLFGEVIEPPQL